MPQNPDIQSYRNNVDVTDDDAQKSQAVRTRADTSNFNNNNNSQTNALASIARQRSGSKRKARESFAATLWNPMRVPEKTAFNRRRLMQLTVGVLIACCGGSSFAFGIFSNKIKESAHFTQAEMTTITTAGSILGSFSFPAGILFDFAGPQYVLGVATVLCCSGFGLLAMIFKGIVTPTVYTVSIANALTAMGVGFTDCGSLMTNLFSFPVNRGEVLIIQKTFFGLGSTFLSLSFDGFFGPSQDYIAYAIYVCILMAIAGILGTLVTRLPPYKRTTLELRRIAKLDPVQQERERLQEELSFEHYHNPRLVDRRRLNAGVTCLFLTLIFFSSFSIAKTYIHIPSNVVTGLTVAATGCLLSFTVMISPFKLPAFFDYEFLPDLHPPEALVDNEDNDEEEEQSQSRAEQGVSVAVVAGTSPLLFEDDDGIDSVVSASRGREYSNAINDEEVRSRRSHTSGTTASRAGRDDYLLSAEGESGGGGGRASAYYGARASVAGGSAPIAVPQALAASVIPSITTKFTTSILQPMIWCFFLTAFAMTGANAVIISNISQIITSANDGSYDQRTNSLAIALQGIGSALGRILIGFLETYFHRRNALAREEQLVWEAENRDEQQSVNGQTGNGPLYPPTCLQPPDMRPVYHRLTSSVVFFLPFTPSIVAVCSLLCTFLPASAFPPVICLFGAGQGAYLGLLALSIREMFSVDVAKHYNFVAASGMLSAILLNRLMFGTWFDQETEKHPAADGVSCVGYSCFAYSLYVLGALCVLAVGSSSFIVYSWWRIRKTF